MPGYRATRSLKFYRTIDSLSLQKKALLNIVYGYVLIYQSAFFVFRLIYSIVKVLILI